MTRIIVLCSLLMAANAFGQPVPTTPPDTPGTVEVSGEFTTGLQGIGNSTDSSKVTEYRDLRNDVFLPSLRLTMRNRQAG